MKGVIDLKIGEKTRGLYFGTAMLLQLEEERGITISDLNQRMKERMVSTIVDIFYCAAVTYCKLNRIDVDFERDDIPQWVDQLGGFAEAMRVFNDAMNDPQSEKNPKALAMTQG